MRPSRVGADGTSTSSGLETWLPKKILTVHGYQMISKQHDRRKSSRFAGSNHLLSFHLPAGHGPPSMASPATVRENFMVHMGVIYGLCRGAAAGFAENFE
jgi:hypothetical protein